MKSSSGKRPVRIYLPNEESLLLVFDVKTCVKEVFDQVCILNSIKESQFFGLTTIVDNEYHFMDLKQKLSKYASKEWNYARRKKDTSTGDRPPTVLAVHFQVQFFVEHPKLIRDSQSRYFYYLHLKRNLVRSRAAARDELIFTLAATALHIDFGSFDETLHTGRYFLPSEYVPTWFIKKWRETYLWSHLPKMHADLSSNTPYHAQSDFFLKASTIDDVPAHYYKLYKTKTEKEPSVMLGISHQGIRLLHLARQRTEGQHLLDLEFPWSKVGLLIFAAKRFEIYPEDLPSSRKHVYFTGSNFRSKCLSKLLRETHSLYMSLSPFVQHMRIANNEKRNYREAYIGVEGATSSTINNAEVLNEKQEKSLKLNEIHQKGYKFQKSSTSHNSSQTSGIGSDARQQRNESDDEAFASSRGLHANSFDSSHDGVICVTQNHLEAPPSKNLSVTNLIDAILDEVENKKDENLSFNKDHSSSPKKTEPDVDIFSGDYFLSHTFLNKSPSRTISGQEGLKIRPKPLSLYEKSSSSSSSSDKKPKSSGLRISESSKYPGYHATSGISDILDLFPDVPQLQAIKPGPSKVLMKAASEDQLAEILHNPRSSFAPNQPYNRTTSLVNAPNGDPDSEYKHQRSHSMDVDMYFGFNVSTPTSRSTETKTGANTDEQTGGQIQRHSDLSEENLKSAVDDADAVGYHNYIHRRSASESFRLHEQERSVKEAVSHLRSTSDVAVAVETRSQKKTRRKSASKPLANSLSRSERRKNIPLTFGTTREADLIPNEELYSTAPPLGFSSKTVETDSNFSKNRNRDRETNVDTHQQNIAAHHRRKSNEMYSRYFARFLSPKSENRDLSSNPGLREKHHKRLRKSRPLSFDYSCTLNEKMEYSMRKDKCNRPYSAPRPKTYVDLKEILV